jgi:hypothetical protein
MYFSSQQLSYLRCLVFFFMLDAAESERLSADARVQQAEARAADLEKFIDKERLLYSEKIRALEATVLQQKSELNDTKRSHDQQVK